jgi:hypothetical protein
VENFILILIAIATLLSSFQTNQIPNINAVNADLLGTSDLISQSIGDETLTVTSATKII